jgi:BirA family biotin operon repressor/biotin-[acetyl-CoA-carboxylase] ligase
MPFVIKNDVLEKLLQLFSEPGNYPISLIQGFIGLPFESWRDDLEYLIESGLSVEINTEQLLYSSSGFQNISKIEIAKAIDKSCANHGCIVESYICLNSTNQSAKEALKDNIQPILIATDYQFFGRGQAGKSWVSPPGDGLLFSVGISLKEDIANLRMVSLMLGAIIHRYLTRRGYQDLEVKWPNDIYCRGKKLCGILVETVINPPGKVDLIMGVGLNLKSVGHIDKEQDISAIGLENCGNQVPEKNLLIGELAAEILTAFESLYYKNNSAIIEYINTFNYLNNKRAVIKTESSKLVGIIHDVTHDGGIQLITNGDTSIIYSGSINLI